MNKYIAAGVAGVLMGLANGVVVADDWKIQFAPHLGMGRMNVDKDHTLSHVDEKLDTLSIGLTAGVVAPVGLMLEIGGYNYSHFSALGQDDFHNLREETLAVGWQFETANGFSIVPKAGRMRWRQTDKESALFHSGPEDQIESRGYEYFGQLTLHKRLSEWFLLGLDFKAERFDFGQAGAIMVVAIFEPWK